VWERIPVFILAGGRGERLAGHADAPKPLLEVAGLPFLLYLLATLKAQGFRRIGLLTGHRAEAFDAWLRGAAAPPAARPERPSAAHAILAGLEVGLLGEGEPLGTGGALRRILPFVEDVALVLNGDSYCRCDARDLLRLHAAHGQALALAATRIANAADYGRLLIDGTGRVAGFREKGEPGPAWANAGVYALPRRFLAEAIPDGPCSLERDVLPRWLEREPVWAERTEGYFCDIGTPERLARARREFPAAAVLGEAGISHDDRGRPASAP
jgi:NDP-sugar pyrophosphorylase family protein